MFGGRRSRFGGRLEPFFRVRLVLYEGRSELLTVTSVETVDPHARLRLDAGGLDSAARACDAVGRIFETTEPHAAVYNLLCNQLALLDADPARATHANALAFRVKLLIAAGLVPQLAACATCGSAEHLVGFSAAAGGVVCSACEAASFPLDEATHAFMTAAVSRPLADCSGRRPAVPAPGRAGDRRDARAPRPPRLRPAARPA